ncbi:MAG TPA: ankyrin repeat domain-containing protein, partial [Pyrinomonadaceae bacterium]|nr:ankyrin repeat domain-containing protein [Pyrinomonadaceae bacterium]
VSIGFMNFDIYSYSIDVSVALRQKVKVLSQPNLSLTATTWHSMQSSISAGAKKRDKLEQVVNHFVCEFQQANRGPNTPAAPCNPFDSPESDVGEEKQPRATSPIDEQLIRAVALNEVDDVKSLITKGADVNARDFADTTPITYAVRAYRPANDATVITLLLKQGANPNVEVRCRLTPLIYAVERGDAKVVELLLNHGANVNAGTPEGFTALMAASALGAPEIVSLLLNKGANKEAQTRTGETALSLAKRFRDRVTGYDRSANIPDGPDRETILIKAAQVKHDRIVTLLQTGK